MYLFSQKDALQQLFVSDLSAFDVIVGILTVIAGGALVVNGIYWGVALAVLPLGVLFATSKKRKLFTVRKKLRSLTDHQKLILIDHFDNYMSKKVIGLVTSELEKDDFQIQFKFTKLSNAISEGKHELGAQVAMEIQDNSFFELTDKDIRLMEEKKREKMAKIESRLNKE